MRMFRSVLSFCCYALAMCVGMVGMASASERLISYHLQQAVATVGEHGSQEAKFKAELAYTKEWSDERPDTVTGVLARESNGFRLISMIANLAPTVSGVAKGKTGIGAGALA